MRSLKLFASRTTVLVLAVATTLHAGVARAFPFTLGDSVDGLFLGRFAHDPSAVKTVLDELAATR